MKEEKRKLRPNSHLRMYVNGDGNVKQRKREKEIFNERLEAANEMTT